MLRTVLILLTLSLLPAAMAQTQSSEQIENLYLKDIQCREQVFANLTSMRAKREWIVKPMRGNDGSISLYTPTNIVGLLVEARVYLNKEVVLTKMTAKYVETRTFNLETCASKQVAGRNQNLFPVRLRKNQFTDDDLRDLLATGRPGIIYVWSPNMPYSYRPLKNGRSAIDEIKNVAAELKMDVTIIADPESNGEFVQRIQRSAKLDPIMKRRMDSLELVTLTMNTHYPVMITYANGRLATHAYPGRGTFAEYMDVVKGQLNELAQ